MYPAPALGALLSEIDKARKTMKGKWKTHLKWLLKQKAWQKHRKTLSADEGDTPIADSAFRNKTAHVICAISGSPSKILKVAVQEKPFKGDDCYDFYTKNTPSPVECPFLGGPQSWGHYRAIAKSILSSLGTNLGSFNYREYRLLLVSIESRLSWRSRITVLKRCSGSRKGYPTIQCRPDVHPSLALTCDRRVC